MMTVIDAIRSANRKLMEALNRGDAEGVAACYTGDATLLPADNPMMKGPAAIRSFWQGAIDLGMKDLKLETLEVESRNDLAYEIGRFALAIQPKGGERTAAGGKYLVVWKKCDGSWKLHVDIWNGSGS